MGGSLKINRLNDGTCFLLKIPLHLGCVSKVSPETNRDKLLIMEKKNNQHFLDIKVDLNINENEEAASEPEEHSSNQINSRQNRRN